MNNLMRLVVGVSLGYALLGVVVLQANTGEKYSLVSAKTKKIVVPSSKFQVEGFSKQCEYHIEQIAENIVAKTYVGAYIHSKLALERCEAVTEDEVEALNTIHIVRNKLMEEN